jgi:hypothetical protein
MKCTSTVDMYLSEFVNLKNVFLHLFYIYLTPAQKHNKWKQTAQNEPEIVCVHGV